MEVLNGPEQNQWKRIEKIGMAGRHLFHSWNGDRYGLDGHSWVLQTDAATTRAVFVRAADQ